MTRELGIIESRKSRNRRLRPSYHDDAMVWEENLDEHEWEFTEPPRLGRRESEPHSHQVSYLYDVLTTNFPNDRTLWDLHHYFIIDGEEVDIQFDISYFRDFNIPFTLSSYRARDFDNRVPTMAVNVLSRSTFYKDIGIIVDRCHRLNIPIYVVVNPYLVQFREYKAPFLRIYHRHPESDPQKWYEVKELREVSFHEDGTVDPEKIIDVGTIVPFKFGIQRHSWPHQGGLPQYRLVLLDPETLEVLPTYGEREHQQAEQERQRAEQERQRADSAERRLKELEAELEHLKRTKRD